MAEREESLLLWGPSVLYGWLFQNWNNPDNLSDVSKRAIRMLLPQEFRNDEELLQRLVNAFEYDRILSALQPDDFERFVDSVIEQESELLNYKLEISLPELRTLLMRTFHRSALFPSQGFTTLLQEAIDASAKAVERLPEVDPAMNFLARQRAIESIHDGMDRALICSERFLELLLEFLARIALRAEAADSDTVDKWLRHAGIPPEDKTERSTWGDKERAMHNAADALRRIDEPPEGWEHLFSYFRNLVFACFGSPQGEIEDPATGQWRKVRYPEEAGEIMQILVELRRHRNPVRHASRTLKASQDIPETYRNAAKGIFESLNHLSNCWQRLRTPAIVKVLSCNEDCFGGLELMLAMEGGRMVTARFINRDMLDKLSTAKQPNDLLALRETPSEFFLFPAPTSEQHFVFHPLLIEREGLPGQIGKVKFTALPTEPIEEEAIL